MEKIGFDAFLVSALAGEGQQSFGDIDAGNAPARTNFLRCHQAERATPAANIKNMIAFGQGSCLYHFLPVRGEHGVK